MDLDLGSLLTSLPCLINCKKTLTHAQCAHGCVCALEATPTHLGGAALHVYMYMLFRFSQEVLIVNIKTSRWSHAIVEEGIVSKIKCF